MKQDGKETVIDDSAAIIREVEDILESLDHACDSAGDQDAARKLLDAAQALCRTAYRYAMAHGGGLAIESEEDKGTVVTITLPLEQEEGEG